MTPQPATRTTRAGRPAVAEEAPRQSRAGGGNGHGRTRRDRSPAGVLVELGAAAVVAVVVSVVLQQLVSRLDTPVPSNAPATLVTATSGIALAVLVAVVLLTRVGFGLAPVAWAALSALTTLALALPLHATRYYLGGISVDQSFRVQYLTRLTSSPELADTNYPDTPPFYPAAWFWAGGRFAALLGQQGWEFYKPYAIGTMAVTAVVTCVLWTLATSRRTALVLAVVTAIVGLRLGATEPYLWLLAATLPPVAVLTWRALGAGLLEARAARGHRATLVGVGAYLGLAGATYTLYFGFTALLFLALAVAVAATARVTTGNWAGAPRTLAPLILLLRLAALGAVAAPIVLLVWLPYLSAAVRSGTGGGAAPRYLPEAGSVLPLPMVEPSALGALCLAGTVWLVLAVSRDRVGRPLACLVAVGYGWYALSTLALAAQTTLLAFRFEQLIVVTFAVSGVLALRDGMRRLADAFPGAVRSRRHEWAVAVVALLAAVSLVQTVPQVLRGDIEAAYTDYYPTGTTATGASDPADPGAWYDEVIGTIDDLTSAAPADLIVFSSDYELMSLRPYRGFQQSTPHYANPLGDFDGRRAEVARWAGATSPADLVARLESSPYRPPDVFVLWRQPDGLHATLSRDRFPASSNVEFYDVVFPESAFAGGGFARRDLGPFAVIARQ